MGAYITTAKGLIVVLNHWHLLSLYLLISTLWMGDSSENEWLDAEDWEIHSRRREVALDS